MEIIKQVDVSNKYDDNHHHNYHHHLCHRNQIGDDQKDKYNVNFLVFNSQEDNFSCP